MIAELIERLEKAEGPDRNLDGAIYWHLLEENRAERELWWVELQFAATPENGDWRKPYTASLDAALSLVERKLPGWKRELEEHVPTDKWPHAVFGNHYWTATIISPEWDGSGGDWRAAEECGKTPALAVCLALLRALSTEA